MKLWIRNQDRKKLTKIICVEYGEWNKEYRIYANGEVCGKYKTKERALEVLDEIQKFISEGGILEFRESQIVGRMESYKNTIYEMPKE
jgi:hypothetical protein